MKMNKSDILQKVKQTVKLALPEATIILFGSQARNDAKNDSDWDILIILDKEKITPSDYDSVFNPLFDLGLQLNEYFSPKIYTRSQWKKRNFTPFYKNIEKEGILL